MKTGDKRDVVVHGRVIGKATDWTDVSILLADAAEAEFMDSLSANEWGNYVRLRLRCMELFEKKYGIDSGLRNCEFTDAGVYECPAMEATHVPD